MTTNTRRASLALAILVVLVGGPSSVGVASAPAVPIARIPFELNGSILLLPVRVNGSKPLSFVLDTGAQGSSVNTTVARALGLKLGKEGRATGAGGTVVNYRISDATVAIGDARLEKLAGSGRHSSST